VKIQKTGVNTSIGKENLAGRRREITRGGESNFASTQSECNQYKSHKDYAGKVKKNGVSAYKRLQGEGEIGNDQFSPKIQR